MPGAYQNLDHIGQVIFARGVVGLELANVFPEQIGAETVDADVAFPNSQLLGRAGLLLDDGKHVAASVANHAAIACGVVEFRGHKRSGSIRMALMLHQRLEQRCGDLRAIAVIDYEQAAQAFERLAPGHERVSGTFLFGLLDEADAARFDGRANLVRLVPHHHEHAFGTGQRERRIHGVLDERFSTGLVQHLGSPRFHARAQAGRQDDNRYASIHYASTHILYYCSLLFNARCGYRDFCRRLRPSMASSIAMAAMASELWRTKADSST